MRKGHFIFISFVIAALLIFFWPKGKKNQLDNEKVDSSNVVLYTSDTCSHCKNVEKWLSENEKIKTNSGIVEKEISSNSRNNTEAFEKAKECGLNPEEKGLSVPFLYDKGTCFIGDTPIIDYLLQKYQ